MGEEKKKTIKMTSKGISKGSLEVGGHKDVIKLIGVNVFH